MSTAEVTAAATAAAATTTVAGPELVVVNATTATPASTVTVCGVSKTVESVPVTVTSGGKDNIIVVMNQIDSGGGVGQGIATAVSGDTNAGGVKMITNKPLTMLPPGATVVKKVVKVKAGGGVGAAVTAAAAQLGKRNIVIASRPGMNQIIACPQMAGQQPSVGSTPVILTQKVAAGGVVTSPVVSTGGLNVAQLGGTKVVAAGTAVSVGQNQTITVAQQSPQAPQQPRVQEVRVDNWANFCIQRLNNMYEKGEWCDLTLRFHSSQELKVHRVVVNICTEYFSNLEKLYGLTDGTLILPKDAEYQTMHTIIKFFYTGKLDVRVGQFNDIYRTVKMMNITILIKLLEAHSRKPVAPLRKDAAGRSVMLQKGVDLGKGQKGQVQIQVANAVQSPASPVISLPVSGSKGLQVTSPGVKLPPGVKTKTVLARVQAQAGKATPVSTKSTSKKLPVWNKERRFVSEHSEPPPLEKWKIKEEEPARPTRFEWGDPDEPDPFLSPGLTNHALMEKQKEKHFTPSSSHRKAEDIFDSVKNLQSQEVGGEQEPSTSTESQPQPSTSGGIKRPLESPSAESPIPKNPKMEAKSPEPSDTEETLMDEITTSAAEEVIISDLTSELVEADAGSGTETSSALEGTEEEVEDPVPSTGEETTPPPTPVEKKPTSILKPALKSPLKSGPDGKEKSSPPKTVRFAADVEKENNEKTGVPLPTSPAPTSSGRIEFPISSIDGGSDPISNHSKIISEVLRKFPDLVKDNKNIKLKIVQKTVDSSGGSAGTSAASGKEQKSKISYIVLKSPGATDASTSTTVLKKSTGSSSVSKFWDTDKTPKKPSPAENMTGPWLCETCGEGENTAIEFETYYNFRRHLVDVHGERIDARICEYCGQKASKRNLLLYHMYTKHGVQPPKNCTFPHCDRCDYVALSESLLNKHKQNHDVNKEFSCSICSASFKSAAQLQAHMSANLHRNKDTKVYECPYCRKPFVRNINLKAHIRSLHRDVARYEEMEDPRLPPDENIANRILLGSGGKRRQFPSILATARSSSATSGSMVEFITSDSLAGQTVSYVTADGQPIEILDTSQLTSLPLTLVSGEDGITTMSAPMESESQVSTVATSEYVTSVSTQQVQSEPVYVMESGAQNSGAVEIDMTNVGLLAPDGTMVYEGEDQSQNFIVQDIQGNQYRRITGIDETGKPVVFLQMIENEQMAPQIMDGNQVVETTTSGSSQMFVSSGAMQLPVSTEAGDGQVAQQMIFATASDGAILEMVPSSESHQVVMSEAVLTQDGQHHEQMEVDHQSHQHFQLVQQSNEEEMGQPVQELQLVLDHQETHVEGQQEGVHIVEVPQSEESYSELQAEGATYIELGQTENAEEEEVGDGNDQTEEETEEMDDTQQLEIDESSQPLQIDEDHSVLKLESLESTQQIDISNEDTEIVTEENLQESIELVEGQTLTLIEEDDGTQTIKVGGSVEEVTS